MVVATKRSCSPSRQSGSHVKGSPTNDCRESGRTLAKRVGIQACRWMRGGCQRRWPPQQICGPGAQLLSRRKAPLAWFLEACGGAASPGTQSFARLLAEADAFGHRPSFVTPYRMAGKGTQHAAACRCRDLARRRPACHMRFVPVKPLSHTQIAGYSRLASQTSRFTTQLVHLALAQGRPWQTADAQRRSLLPTSTCRREQPGGRVSPWR